MAAFRISTMLLCVGIAVTADRTYSLQKYNRITDAMWQTVSVVITLSLKHLWGYITPWVGNLMEWKSRVLNEIAGMMILVPIVCWKYNLVTFWWWHTLNDVLDIVLQA
jgi:surface polysaccharide O-acyltransferase-like enzyme